MRKNFFQKTPKNQSRIIGRLDCVFPELWISLCVRFSYILNANFFGQFVFKLKQKSYECRADAGRNFNSEKSLPALPRNKCGCIIMFCHIWPSFCPVSGWNRTKECVFPGIYIISGGKKAPGDPFQTSRGTNPLPPRPASHSGAFKAASLRGHSFHLPVPMATRT